LSPAAVNTCKAIIRVFETGRPRGRYDAVAVLKGDKGGVSYGVCQFTRASGRLWDLVRLYRDMRGAMANELMKWSTALMKRRPELDTDLPFRAALKRAAQDPVMRAAQERLYDEQYWAPAAKVAHSIGLVEPLSHAVMLDSTVHGSRDYIIQKADAYAGRASAAGERQWIPVYLEKRRAWLHGKGGLLRKTCYRVDNLAALATAGLWALPLPLLLPERKVTIKPEGIV
jgi:chitosanase